MAEILTKEDSALPRSMYAINLERLAVRISPCRRSQGSSSQYWLSTACRSHLGDRCTSRFGRQRPFILAGKLLLVAAVLIIGYAADVGWLFGDTEKSRPLAIDVFVFGFWILDMANNVTQGPCRALLADLTGKDHRRTYVANTYYSLFMAIGNFLGYATGSYRGWFRIFPFTYSLACNVSCANLKSSFVRRFTAKLFSSPPLFAGCLGGACLNAPPPPLFAGCLGGACLNGYI